VSEVKRLSGSFVNRPNPECLAVTDAARIQLKAQGTQVLAVYAGFIDTNMASELAGADEPKTSPRQVAERTLQGIREGVHHVRADKRSEETWDSVRKDPEGPREINATSLG
jgi:NAD(P)-dependent dehydrogenase (short-subunit alcohol dehydrogenase family)